MIGEELRGMANAAGDLSEADSVEGIELGQHRIR